MEDMTTDTMPESIATPTLEMAVEAPIETPISAPAIDAEEAAARKSGWVPKEEFKGDPSEWKSAKQFNEFGELLEHTHQQKRKIQKLTETTEQLVNSIKTIQEQSYQKALAELQAKTREAVAVGDVDTFERLQAEQNQLQKPQTFDMPELPKVPDHIMDSLNRFKAENTWFKPNPSDATATAREKAMTAFAIAKEQELLTKGVEYGIILKTIKEDVRKEYASYFGNPNQSLPSAVNPPAGSPATRQKISISDLPAEHRTIIKNLKQTMGDRFNADKYIADLKELGAI